MVLRQIKIDDSNYARRIKALSKGRATDLKAKESDKSDSLNRKDLQLLMDTFCIDHTRKSDKIKIANQMLLSGTDIINVDFRGFTYWELEVLNFKNTDISGAKLDRETLGFFKKYIKKKLLICENLDVQGVNLGTIHYRNELLGIECILHINFSDVEIPGINCTDANLDRLVLDNANIDGGIFINAKNLTAEQFAYTRNFQTARFFEDQGKDNDFKQQLEKLSKKPKPQPKKPVQNTANMFAAMFDDPDQLL